MSIASILANKKAKAHVKELLATVKTEQAIRLSFSAINDLRTCERRFEKNRLLENAAEREDAPHFSRGHCFGAGVASYLNHGDWNRAIFEGWLAYWPNLEDMKDSVWNSLHLLSIAKPKLDAIRSEWEVAIFNGRPAVELSFRLNISKSLYFVGYIDAVLQHRRDGHYAVLENKTTSAWLDDLSPLYQNSGQGIGYSIVLDKIADQPIGKYSLFYLVAQMKRNITDSKIHKYEWNKTLLDRLNWFLTLGLDVKHLNNLIEMNLFPMRGSGCNSFNRVCPYFGTCNMRSFDKKKTIEQDTIVYDFEYFLDDIIAEHIERVQAVSKPAKILEIS